MKNPVKEEGISLRVLRGGSWRYFNAKYSRVLRRDKNTAHDSDGDCGFRIVKNGKKK